MQPKTDTAPRERARLQFDTAGSILSVRVRGEIDHHTAAEIRRGIDTALFEKRPKKFILDLSAVSFMDSSGLGLIMGRYSVMKELEGEMVVWNPSPETRAILTLAGMERMVRIEYPADGGNRTASAPAVPSADRPASSAKRQSSPRRPSGGEASLARTSPRKRKRSPSSPRPSTEADRKERDA